MAEIKLSKERYAELLRAERALLDLLPEYDKAESCGIDCSPLKALHDEYMERIQSIKDNYGPKVR